MRQQRQCLLHRPRLRTSKLASIETSQFPTEPGVIDFGIGQPQLALLPHDILLSAAQKRLIGQDNTLLNYGPARGDGHLRIALAEFLSPRYGCPMDPALLFMTGGASQALQLIAATFAQPGDVVLVEEPTYFLAHKIFSDRGLQVVGVPLGPQGLEPAVLEAALVEHRPALVYTIPVHQNPTGITMAADYRQANVALCRHHSAILIADEVYQLLNYQGTPPPPLAAQIDSESVIAIGSFSKILAPGLRLGWMQAAEPLLARLSALGLIASGGGLNHFTGCLVENVLTNGQQALYLEFLKDTYRHRVDLMDRLLQTHLSDRVRYTRPQGGYFFWLELQEGRDAESLAKRAAELKVGYRAGPRFSTGGDFSNCLRLSFAHYDDAAITSGIERLAKLLE